MANLMEESIKPNEKFPSTDFSSEPVLYQDLDVETFNKELTPEQKAYINTYLGTIEEFVDAMLLLYNEVGNGVDPMISIDDYVEELLNDNGITEWSQELADMLGFDLKTESKNEYEEISKLPKIYENNLQAYLNKIKYDGSKFIIKRYKVSNGYTVSIFDNSDDSVHFVNYNHKRVSLSKFPNEGKDYIPDLSNIKAMTDEFVKLNLVESKNEVSYGDLEDLAKDIYDWFDSDMGTHFDEIQGNEEETYGDIMTALETKDQAQIQNFINTIKEADIDDETAKEINIATTSSLLNRLNTLLKNKKQEGKSKFYTADKMFDDFLKTAKEEADENGYTFKLSDLGLTKEDSADFKNLLLQRDEIEDVSYDPQNNTYTVKVTGVENVEKPDDNDSDEK